MNCTKLEATESLIHLDLIYDNFGSVYLQKNTKLNETKQDRIAKYSISHFAKFSFACFTNYSFASFSNYVLLQVMVLQNIASFVSQNAAFSFPK